MSHYSTAVTVTCEAVNLNLAHALRGSDKDKDELRDGNAAVRLEESQRGDADHSPQKKEMIKREVFILLEVQTFFFFNHPLKTMVKQRRTELRATSSATDFLR